METTKLHGCLRVVIPLTDTTEPLLPLLHLGFAFANEVRKIGGKAKCFKVARFVIVEMSGVPKARIESLVDCLGHSPSMKDASLRVIIEERSSPEMDLDSEALVPGEFTSQRLTRKFLFGLPDGAIVVGNESRDGVPTFISRLDGVQDRSRVWRRAINVNAAQRICSVYWHPSDILEIHGVDLSSCDDDDDDLAPPAPWIRL